MRCLVNDIIDTYHRKGKRVEVIRRYLRMKYRINIDIESIQERVKTINLKYNFE